VSGAPGKVEILAPGMMTTVQDWPGRVGLWRVGVPPSGPMDDLSFRLGNWALGNEEGAAGLECTMVGPRLRFGAPATVMVTGAEATPTVDGEPAATWEPLALAAGAVLDVGTLAGLGLAGLFFAYQVRRFRRAATVVPELYEGQSPDMPGW